LPESKGINRVFGPKLQFANDLKYSEFSPGAGVLRRKHAHCRSPPLAKLLAQSETVLFDILGNPVFIGLNKLFSASKSIVSVVKMPVYEL
jgi:hypothetical protein